MPNPYAAGIVGQPLQIGGARLKVPIPYAAELSGRALAASASLSGIVNPRAALSGQPLSVSTARLAVPNPYIAQLLGAALDIAARLTVSENPLRRSAFAEQTEDVWLFLLTISHADLPSELRFVDNTVNIVSRGNTYTAFPFELELPSSTDRGPPAARLRIDNVSREIGEVLRSVGSPVTVKIEVVRAAVPDMVEAAFEGFKLRNVEVTALEVTGTLMQEDIVTEPYPAHAFTPASFPGLF